MANMQGRVETIMHLEERLANQLATSVLFNKWNFKYFVKCMYTVLAWYVRFLVLPFPLFILYNYSNFQTYPVT